MTRSPLQIMETVNEAQSVMEHLHARLSTAHSINDLGDLSVIQTAVRQIEELLGLAILWPRKQRVREQTTPRERQLATATMGPLARRPSRS